MSFPIRFSIITLMLTAFSVVSCKQKIKYNPEAAKNKIQQGIEAKLSTYLYDFSSYEPLYYEPPKVLYSDFNETQFAKEYYRKSDSIMQSPENNGPNYENEKKRIYKSLDSISNLFHKALSQYKADSIGYSIKHSYMEKDQYGRKVKKRKEFIMDLDFKVIDMVNLDPDAG